MLILLLLSGTISGVARGSGPPRAALLGGGGKIEVILKNSVRGKEFLGGKNFRGVTKEPYMDEK